MDVHDYHVRAQFARQLDGFAPVGRLADDLDAHAFEIQPGPLTDDFMIFCQQYAHRFTISHACLTLS